MVHDHRLTTVLRSPECGEEPCKGINRRTSLGWLGALSAPLSMLPSPAGAQELPKGVVTLVVPFAPGSPPDTYCRVFSEKFGKRVGRSVVTDLRPGANTTIGTAFASKARPDGQTLLYATNSSLTAAPFLFKNLQYDPTKDFSAITVMLESYFCILVRAEDAALTVESLAERIRKDPGGNAMAGGSTTAEVANKMFQNAAKLDHSYVRYNSNQMYTDLWGGRLNAVWAPMATAMVMANQGKTRILAITGPQRLPLLPQVPTLDEFYPGLVVESWSGFFVPSATPRPLIDMLYQHVSAVVHDKELLERGRLDGNKPLTLTPRESDAYVKKDFPHWRDLLQNAGIEPA